MLERLFGSVAVERILFFLLVNEKGHPSEIARNIEQALSPVQRAFDRLEQAGIVVSFVEGRNRLYQFNPRYPFLKELERFLQSAYNALPSELREKYYERPGRKRPRKRGKPLRYVRGELEND